MVLEKSCTVSCLYHNEQQFLNKFSAYKMRRLLLSFPAIREYFLQAKIHIDYFMSLRKVTCLEISFAQLHALLPVRRFLLVMCLLCAQLPGMGYHLSLCLNPFSWFSTTECLYNHHPILLSIVVWTPIPYRSFI